MSAPAPAPADQQHLLRTGAWAPLARDVVRVEGPEATAFLQGQLSQDVDGVDVGDAVWSLLLAPTGKVDAWLRVTRLEPATWLLDVDPGAGDAVVARLERFKLRNDAEVVRDDRWTFRAVRGPAELDLRHPAEVTVHALPVWWPGLVGYDLLIGDDQAVRLDLPEVGPAALEVVRVECGVPAMGAELTEATIPAEAGQWLVDASVSFTKGCFTGQELVARIDSRGGNVPRPLRGVVVAGGPEADEPPVGAEVVVDGTPVGVLTSVVRSAAMGAVVALAPVGRSVEPGAAVTVVTDGGQVAAEVRSLPLVPGPSPT